MSFLRDFGGGFAKQLTENLIDERDRMNKLADDETYACHTSETYQER